ncbi:MAG: Ca2+-dependent phosphoinositide-specific phospholipase C [Bacteroidota bacterium]
MKHLAKTVFLVLFMACQASEKNDQVRLNHIQVIGSHNSYKMAIEKPLMDLLIREDSSAIGLDYAHFTLTEQLDFGIRGLELDVLYDPHDGAFQTPKGMDILYSLGITALPYDTMSLKISGLKVFHIPDIDFRSHYLTFKGCLGEVQEWSQAHPDHIPVIITINPKNFGIEKPGFTKVILFDAQILDSLDKEISEVFHMDYLITLGFVKQDHKNLRQAIIEKGWPALDDVRGRILLVLDAGERVTEEYLKKTTTRNLYL